MVSYIDDHKKVFGVEPICRVLTEHGMPIAPSTYYEASGRAPSRHAVRDVLLRAEVARVHQANYGVYGARKVWLQLNREHIPIAHCTVRRLMRELDLSGARRGKKKRTTIADPQALRAQDLVNRKFDPAAPNTLWVADFKCRRRHLKSYADLRTMPTSSGDGRRHQVVGVERSA
jgi:putative transposase